MSCSFIFQPFSNVHEQFHFAFSQFFLWCVFSSDVNKKIYVNKPSQFINTTTNNNNNNNTNENQYFAFYVYLCLRLEINQKNEKKK